MVMASHRLVSAGSGTSCGHRQIGWCASRKKNELPFAKDSKAKGEGSLREVKQSGGASMRRSLLKAKLKLLVDDMYHPIQMSVTCEGSSHTVREKCVSQRICNFDLF
eukprot:6201524-Pleurochrysis_carterae.AAC.3